LEQDQESGEVFFTGIGITYGDGGLWIRQQCLVLSQVNHTPVDFWLTQPLEELRRWITAHNSLIPKEKGKEA
jgi:hypothetical protein